MLALHTVFYGWAVFVSRSLVQVVPEQVRKLWNNWEIRVLVLVSLILQLFLLHFGFRRRYSPKSWLSVSLWLSYLGADSVAIVALGVISNNQGNCDDSLLQNGLIAFWSPFLLLHLGGQDTITAYAVQDNELWLRHLLGLIVQSGLAVYIILLSWEVRWLSFLTIPLFLAGFIKYAERIWVLKSANSDMGSGRQRLANEIFDFKLMDYALGLINRPPEFSSRSKNIGIFHFFKIVRCLFLNQKADLPSYDRDYAEFRNSQTAWSLIEGELGYAYDLYYTKAPLFFTKRGFLIRTFSFTSIVFVFVCFLIKEWHEHPFVDLIVTLLLLVGAILIEIYGVVLLCSSDWPVDGYGVDWYGVGPLSCCIEALRSGCAKLTSKQRWSNSMGQLDLIGFCHKDMSLQYDDGTPTLSTNFRGWALNKMLPKLNGDLELLSYMTRMKVTDGLKDFVFRTFWLKREWDSKGFVAQNFNGYITDGTECIETYQKIIIWHIATEICLYNDCSVRDVSNDLEQDVARDVSNNLEQEQDVERDVSNNLEQEQDVVRDVSDDLEQEQDVSNNLEQEQDVVRDVSDDLEQDVSKYLSHYMMYILAMVPLVLSTGSAKRVFERTCRDVRNCITEMNRSNRCRSHADVCRRLFEFDSGLTVYKALLEDDLFPLGARLARRLVRDSRPWRILSSFWCENLVYVATLCPGDKHAQLLRNGGEFLSHVWLLEEHYNLQKRAQKKGLVQEVLRVSSVGRDNAAAAVPEEDEV